MNPFTRIATSLILLLLIPLAMMTQNEIGKLPGVTLLEDSTITVIGTAYDAKGGAVVLLKNETPIYLQTLGSWSDEFYGRKVRVEGKLRLVFHEDSAAQNEAGEMVQSMQGQQLIIDDPVWELE